MKKQILFTIIFLTIVLAFIVGYLKINQKEMIDPIENVTLSYKNYKFHEINKNNLVFKPKELKVKYDMTKESSVIKMDGKSISAYLIDDYLHIMVDDIDYKYPDLGEIDRLMFSKWCDCNTDCYRLFILTDEGEVLYINLNNSIDFENPDIFNKFESTLKYKNIGYVDNLNIDSECGINGIALIDESGSETIYDNNLNRYEQTYYTFIKNNNHTLYIYPDGYVSLDTNDKSKSRFKEILVSDKEYYLIGVDYYLYSLDYNNQLNKKSNKKIVKIGRNKNDAIVVFEDATAIKLSVKSMLK